MGNSGKEVGDEPTFKLNIPIQSILLQILELQFKFSP
jgi:hypothetical protein